MTNRYILISIKANLKSCVEIGVNPGVNKLIEISIDKIDTLLYEEDVRNDKECDEYA